MATEPRALTQASTCHAPWLTLAPPLPGLQKILTSTPSHGAAGAWAGLGSCAPVASREGAWGRAVGEALGPEP